MSKPKGPPSAKASDLPDPEAWAKLSPSARERIVRALARHLWEQERELKRREEQRKLDS